MLRLALRWSLRPDHTRERLHAITPVILPRDRGGRPRNVARRTTRQRLIRGVLHPWFAACFRAATRTRLEALEVRGLCRLMGAGSPLPTLPRMRGRVGRGCGRTLQRVALGDPLSKALEPPFGRRRSAAAPLRPLRG